MMLGRIAQYELLEKIGEGGMGVVFKSRDSRLDKLVAVKILLDEFARDAEYRARFLREARAEASLNHPAIAMCFDVGEARLDPPDLLQPGGPGPHPERALYLTMEYVPGTDLLGLVGDRPLEIPRVLDLTLQIAAGLESAHGAGVIHRDLKSTNIRVTPQGQVKIVDFGLSRTTRTRPRDETPTLTTSKGRVMGTVHFMAPEQAHGRTTDPRSDLFSLGVIAYQLVTGRLPFTGGTEFEVANAIASEDPPPMARYASRVPDELERVVRKLIAKDPEQRYQSAHEVRTDLQRLQQGVARPGRSTRARVTRAVVIAAAALVVGIVAWWVWRHMRPPPAPAIAVMPFVNRTGDPRFDYLGDGIAASVVGDLVSVTGFNVASLPSLQGIGPGNRGAAAVAHELGVNAVVEGTLRREGGITTVDVQLVDARRGFVLWAERFPYALQNAADVQRAIVREVARKLGGSVRTPKGSHRSVTPRSPSAYDLTLRSSAYLEDPDDPQGPDRALELCSQALEVDPDFAMAWAGKSRALWRIWNRDKTEASLRLAEEAANRAIRLNPELLEARVARAQIYRATSRIPESIRELREVLGVNPNWDEALVHLAASLRESGDLAGAEATLHQAVAQRPAYWRNWNSLGALLIKRGDYDGARVAFREIIRLVPEKNRGYEQLAAIEIMEGDGAAALAAYERLPSPINSGALASNIGTAYFFQRRLAEARRYYVLALELEPRDFHRWVNLGDLHAREGKADSARADYAAAVRLLEAMLHVDPKNLETRLDRAVCLAKSGRCAEAEAALDEIRSALPANDAQSAHRIAMLNSLCNRRAATLAAVRRAVALGISPRLLRQEDEFQGLARDPQFLAITEPRKS